jgi:hypothetical protein
LLQTDEEASDKESHEARNRKGRKGNTSSIGMHTRRHTSVSDDEEQRLKMLDLKRITQRPNSVNDNEEQRFKMLDLRRNYEGKS